MRKLIFATVAVLLVSVGFFTGRLTKPAPNFELGEIAGDAPLEQAWDEFLRAQQETLELFRSSPFFEDDQQRAEAYRGLLYSLVGSIKAGALMQHDYPRFMTAVDWTSKSGLDNPDNNYYIAMIRDDADYRITGTRGTTTNLIFQLVVGQPGVRGAGSSTNVSVLYGHELNLDEELLVRVKSFSLISMSAILSCVTISVAVFHCASFGSPSMTGAMPTLAAFSC